MTFSISQFVSQPDIPMRDYFNLASQSISESPVTFGFSTSIASQLTAAASAYDTAMSALDETEKAYRAAVQDKKAAREALVEKILTYYPMAYANPAVSDGTLATIYLAPRVDRRSFVTPTQPLQFSVAPRPTGFAKFKWKRNGNTTATTFVLEQQTGTGDWEAIWSGTRTSIELEGFEPGIETSFRVIASKSDVTSEPSDIVTIYPNNQFNQLSVAA